MSSIGVIHYNWPGYDLEGFARRASEIGYTSCELQIGDIWDEADDDDGRRAEQVRALFDSVGMTISAVAAGNDFLQAERSDWEAQVARYRRVCQIIPHAGTDIIRSDGGWNRGGLVPEGKWDGMMLEAFQRCAEFLEELNVRIALDNHGVSTNDGDWQLSLIERFVVHKDKLERHIIPSGLTRSCGGHLSNKAQLTLWSLKEARGPLPVLPTDQLPVQVS
ncbi:MAG: sugar phosphate isomerase/epimerase, partial [Gemmatimonadetes bacterium]|nr:sugar phosphate isomerase/epimerase [Gemmatimonadota bacterium]